MKQKTIEFNIAWPTELERAVRGLEDENGFRTVEASPENVGQIGTIAFAMDMAGLTSREQSVLLLKHAFGQTLEEIGRVFGVTRERVRQVEAKAIRKMRRPGVMELIKLGTVSYIQREIWKKAKAMNEEFVSRWNAAHGTEGTESIEPAAIIENKYVTLEEMDLSVRAYNCLKRAMLNNLGDIIRLCREEGMDGLMKVRNLGRKSMDEVISMVKKKYNVDLMSIMEGHGKTDAEVPE